MNAGDWLIAFVGSALCTWGWTLMVDSVRTQTPADAALAGAFLYYVSAKVTALYVHHEMLIYPATIGDGCGLFAAIGWLRLRDGH